VMERQNNKFRIKEDLTKIFIEDIAALLTRVQINAKTTAATASELEDVLAEHETKIHCLTTNLTATGGVVIVLDCENLKAYAFLRDLSNHINEDLVWKPYLETEYSISRAVPVAVLRLGNLDEAQISIFASSLHRLFLEEEGKIN